MKKSVLVLLGAALLIQLQAANAQKTPGDLQNQPSPKGSITIACSPDLFSLTSKWAGDYTAINPKVKVNVVSLTDATGENMEKTGASLAFVSHDFGNAAGREPAWKMVIGRDAVVPVINSKNPFLGELVSQGISAEDFARLFNAPKERTWANLLQGGENVPVNVYLIDNPSVLSTLADFVKMQPASLVGNRVAGGPEMIGAILKDPSGIGFCKLADLTGPSGQDMVSGISLLPIDKNANGKMDYIEKIFDNPADLSRGIWIGKFPGALCRNIYVTAPARPTGDHETAFLKYVLTSGQQYLVASGFSMLQPTERLSKIDKLPVTFLRAQTSDGVNITQLIITIIAGIICILAILGVIIRYRRNNTRTAVSMDPIRVHAVSEKSLVVPRGLFFDRTHTWTFMEKDGTVRIGVDDFLQHVTGAITGIKMKLPGEKVKKGEPVMTLVQKGKRLIISSPVSGIIIAENPVLFTDSSLLNTSPYGEGWIYRIEPTNWLREMQFLFMAEKYHEWIRNEFSRLRDFLAHAVKPNDPEYACVTLQDGGEITDRLLENLGPEVWEEFQTNFIDTAK